MASYYTTQFQANTVRGTSAGVDATTSTYYGMSPTIEQEGGEKFIQTVFTNVAATPLQFSSSDRLFIAGPFPANCRIVSIDVVPSADLDSGNTFTFNLGWTTTPTALLSASTGLQTGTFTAVTSAQYSGQSVSAEGDFLELRPTAGALAVAGTLTFRVTVANMPT